MGWVVSFGLAHLNGRGHDGSHGLELAKRCAGVIREALQIPRALPDRRRDHDDRNAAGAKNAFDYAGKQWRIDRPAVIARSNRPHGAAQKRC
jgi:hypothetical protein